MSHLETINGQPTMDIQQIKDKVRKIVEKCSPDKIILLGSYAKGYLTSGRDIDLLVIMNAKQSTLDLGAEISLLLRYSFPMDIIVRTPLRDLKTEIF
ncbi:nucleotidyltransferase domain-containing protein [candidate division KSB1 bacterium]|nr:nucleotidyltransferase domain-containing protein [candidate division KSB1 bacterium]NIR71579.1 nucleotidyltransferase domain-containing protein [candidate division KSB1 bacterium]NIS27961.1 nucleotidyltransferase domain-containing protein [candidate division KSB1 bacterium]NIT74842.1 nucleotidyltransferase domain-containing protein [candidate division KSB1 bacterium]NIU28618.1 nucleotidyltransferase domain-containing protein [candidate division KSB1 bacterium]